MLPPLIEIIPLEKPVKAEITVPGSKSITNRALILAALADGEVTLGGALWSEDTQIMVECLQELGFMVDVRPDPDEACNRTITVYGKGGVVPPGGTESQPMELFVGNAGTAARFLAAFVCLGKGVYRLHGVDRMHERPQAALFKALRELGYRVEPENRNDRLPARIVAGTDAPSAPKRCTVSIEESSQFASGLLLCAKVGGWQVEVTGENAEESPYVAMTSKLIDTFPSRGGKFQIESDASSTAYFMAAGAILQKPRSTRWNEFGIQETTTLFDPITIVQGPVSGWQVDQRFSGMLSRVIGLEPELPDVAKRLSIRRHSRDEIEISRLRDLGDSIMMAIVLAPLSVAPIKFTELARLRVQECERVVGLRTELTRCGAKVIEEGDTLMVHPSTLHGAEIETYNDHRMAMCFAILGLKVAGIKINNPACVKKTFPNFFQKLAAPPPKGLGAMIRDAKTGRALEESELFAE